MTREWEKNLLFQAEGLGRLQHLFDIFEGELGNILEQYEEYLDKQFVMLLLVVQGMVAQTLESSVELDEDSDIPGINKQLEDVMDEIHVFQAGLKTKKGVKDENDDDEPEKNGG